jgi:hypothetical protein
MTCKTLDFWPDEHLPMPPRSQLFSLPMIGVGTSGQEALSSYLVRLANLHSVNPNVLVSRVLFPLTTIERNSVAGNFSSIYAKTMNGIGKYAMEFSSALAQLTCRSELAFGTCLPWRDVLDSKAVGLLSPHPRWCPACYAERRIGNLEPYMPLSWFVRPIAHCTVHQKLLIDRCPNCNHHQPFIPKHQYLDHCSRCKLPLSMVAKDPVPKSDMHPASISRFFSVGFVEMIAEGPRCESFAKNERFVKQTKRLVQVLGGGNLAAMHRKLGLREKAAAGWVRDGCRPALMSYLNLCHRTGIKPVNFLRDEIPHDLQLGGQRYAPPDVGGKRVLSKAEKLRIESYLRKAMEPDAPAASIKAVASKLGYPHTFLRCWWSDLVIAIGQKHKNAVHERSKERLVNFTRRIEEISREIFDLRPNAPARDVLLKMIEEHVTLEWRAARAIIREVRATYSTEAFVA